MRRNCKRCDVDISNLSLTASNCSDTCRKYVARHPHLQDKYPEQDAWREAEGQRRATERREARKVAHSATECRTCGESFVPSRSDRIYCSLTCAYARQRDETQLQRRRQSKNATARTPEGRSKEAERSNRRRARKACGVDNLWTVHHLSDDVCYWRGCKVDDSNRVIEHVMPLALGGAHSERNTVTACWDCNEEKRATHPLVWIAQQFEEA